MMTKLLSIIISLCCAPAFIQAQCPAERDGEISGHKLAVYRMPEHEPM